MKTCSMIVRHADGSTEKRDYESYAEMKGDARREKERGACVLYWWCNMDELRGGESE